MNNCLEWRTQPVPVWSMGHLVGGFPFCKLARLCTLRNPFHGVIVLPELPFSECASEPSPDQDPLLLYLSGLIPTPLPSATLPLSIARKSLLSRSFISPGRSGTLMMSSRIRPDVCPNESLGRLAITPDLVRSQEPDALRCHVADYLRRVGRNQEIDSSGTSPPARKPCGAANRGEGGGRLHQSTRPLRRQVGQDELGLAIAIRRARSPTMARRALLAIGELVNPQFLATLGL